MRYGTCSQVGVDPANLFENVNRLVLKVLQRKIDEATFKSIVNDFDAIRCNEITNDSE